jgi:tryptophan 2,3-dioxygenase
MYHQVNELIFNDSLGINQISHAAELKTDFFYRRLMRISRYFDMLTSFSIMENGMEVEQYMKFRNTLTPASGSSAQYRLIEFCCT